ncbi:MAG TPA: cell division protein FtsA [Kiritimatiellia bacterium]|nr:cell division protein FtsA [Kiritimatiellia bacterium]HNR93727.1 cell division protein FtsA [Kiritimatiellia bacterium]HPA78301.1 cell division protein FtsA [Kiritimatiellia bacterium]HQQ04725.1 cell division protein FtsA [Kiritimatiellia bacterium]
MPSSPIAAIEVGTSKVCVLVGDLLEDDQLMIVGQGVSPSRGVRKGQVTDLDNVTSCLNHALEQAEEQADVTVSEAYVVISGDHIQSMTNRGSVPVRSPGGLVAEEEVEDVGDLARAVALPTERAILHSIAQRYYLDDQHAVLRPEGMEAARLTLDMLIIHCLRNRIKNVVRTLKEVNVEVADIAFGGLMSGMAVLSPEQKQGGAIVIDLGGGTTDYLVYANMAIAAAGSLSVGGDHVTNDIALGLGLPHGQAEELKKNSGSAVVSPAAGSQTVALQPEGGFPGKNVRLSDIQTIINARMEETFELVRDSILRSGLRTEMVSGVILTGGGAHLEGAVQLASEIFNRECQIGRPRNVNGLAVVTEGPQYAAPLGMLQHAVRSRNRGRKSGILGALINLIKG